MRALALGLLMALGGCADSKVKDIGACKMDADRMFPDTSTDQLYEQHVEHVKSCMEARGYKLKTTEACFVPDSSRADPACYTGDL